MGKNQAYKAMQRSRVGSTSGGPDDVEDGMVDGSFHSPEWHAARLASLKTSHTVTWEEYKKKQKEEEMKKGELEADKDKMMREYRAQLDAERASKLAHGRNHSKIKSSSSTHNRKADKKDKDLKKHTNKKRKHLRKSCESRSSSSSSESSSSGDNSRDLKRSKSRSRRKRKEKRHRLSKSKQRHLSSDDDEEGEEEEEADGPLPLSRFFGAQRPK